MLAGIKPADGNSTYEECLAYCQAFEDTAALAHPMMAAAMPEFSQISARTEVIKGVDGNDINLYIHERSDPVEGLRPCIFHIHGGGMALMTAADPNYVRLRHTIADAGLLVAGVEFRNAGGKLGNHPFPAGLNDCASALKWVHGHRKELGISVIVVAGESGGGNLSLATTLKAKQEDWLDAIDGVYAMCPYISGSYENPPPNLLSLEENNGYSLNCDMMAALVKVYDPSNAHGTNPLAWPYHASPEHLADLPPHIISVNELDPLRDEGLEYYRKLRSAGNAAVARTVHGTNHGGDLGTPDITPEIFNETMRSICGFARSLAG